MKHFKWMVINKVDKRGIWFESTKDRVMYVWYWNPFKMIHYWISGDWSFGWFPFKSKHIWD